ncbi:MAG TPA: hypothetical protein VEK08_14675 [Planctomycetota bacterium]|nr:hypothetical protein [Planctomycetota bacterium]
MRNICGALCLAVLLSGALEAGEVSRELQRRIADRETRAKLIKSLPDSIRKGQSAFLTAQAAICQWLITHQAKTDAAVVMTEIELIDDKHASLAGLKKSIDAITSDTPLDETKKKDLAARRKSAQKVRATGFFELAKTYFSSGLPRHAFDLVQQALELDPDLAPARQALGQVKGPDGWTDAFSAAQASKGHVYVPERGWVPAQAAERIKKGEWFENGRWMSIDDADKAHAEMSAAWTVETQHFIIKSNAPRHKVIALAERLEAFRQVCYRECVEFFQRGERKPQISFTHAPKAKLLVHYMAQRKDYEAAIKNEFKGPLKAFIPFLMLFPGFYTPTSHASYFDMGDENPIQQFFVLHEVGRQMLGEFAQVGVQNTRPWINEGIAGVVTFARPDQNGKWYIPTGRSHDAVTKAAELLVNGGMVPLSVLVNMEEAQFNKEPGAEARRTESAAFARYLIDAKDGIYATDFMELVYDTFKGVKTATFADYLGDAAEFEKGFVDFLQGGK